MFLIICLGTAAIAHSRIGDDEPVKVTACYDGQPHSAIGTVKVNNPNETVVWYDSNGNIVTSPSLTEPGTTTFYAATRNAATGHEGAKRPVSITIYPKPRIPKAHNVTTYADGTTYTASATAGFGEEIVWYDAFTEGNRTTAPGRSAEGITNAYAVAKNMATGCESIRIPVSVILYDGNTAITTEASKVKAAATVRLTDVKDDRECGCSQNAEVTLNGYTTVRFNIPTKVDITCSYGNNDGSITVPAPGGGSESGWQYSKDGGINWQNSNVFRDLTSGVYPVRVKDGIGNLSAVVNVEIRVPEKGIIFGPLIKDRRNRSITIPTPTGGSGSGWQYSIDDGKHWQTSNVFDNLESDFYAVQVKDGNGCLSMPVYGDMMRPDIDIISAKPPCNNLDNGVINITASGGTPPYLYIWSDGSEEQSRSNLSAGIYEVFVIDAENYSSTTQKFVFSNLAPLDIDFGEYTVLCKNTTAELRAHRSSDTTVFRYQWYRDGQPFSRTPVITVTDRGTYRVEARLVEKSEFGGCIIARGEINVSERDYEIATDFAVTTNTADKTVTRLVNISYPDPDKIEWIIPQNNTDVVSSTGEYADLIFEKNGCYRIGLQAWKGDCSATVYKEIEINGVNDPNIIVTENVPEKGETTLLKSFIAYPNPNNGQFTVHVELGIKTDIRLRILTLTGAIVDERMLKGSDRYDVHYNLNNIHGLYIIHLSAGNVNTALKLITGTTSELLYYTPLERYTMNIFQNSDSRLRLFSSRK
jgi:hypothetical protein